MFHGEATGKQGHDNHQQKKYNKSFLLKASLLEDGFFNFRKNTARYSRGSTNATNYDLFRSLREFETTLTELSAIAAAAYIGFSKPSAATGIPTTL